MSTCKALLVGLVVTLVTGAASSSAATSSASMCLTSSQTKGAKPCGPAQSVSPAVVTLVPLDDKPGVYQLSIPSANTGVRAKPITWTPPASMTIEAITRTEHGHCSLLRGRLACVAAKPGRSITVNLAAEIGVDRDALSVATFLDPPRGLFRLSVVNKSASCCVRAFSWVPPVGMTVTKVTRVAGGQCSLVSDRISCIVASEGLVPAEGCRSSCRLTVDFTADGLKSWNGKYWTYYGIGGSTLQCLTMCPMGPVPYHGGSATANVANNASPCPGVLYAPPPAGSPTPPTVTCTPGLVGIGNVGMTPAERAAVEGVAGASQSFGGGLPCFVCSG